MISIIFTLYNEEEVLPFLIKRVREVMAKEPDAYELIFVNDDSTDNSAQVILAQGKAPKEEMAVVNMSRRFGVEECFMAGLGISRGNAAILMYTDMQDPPETIHEMLSKWRQGADIVHTIRRQRIGEKQAKRIAVGIAYQWIAKISEIQIPRDSGEFKLLSRRAVDHLLKFTEKEPYLRGLIPWIGFKQDQVQYDLMPRQAGKSKVSLFGTKALKVFLSGIISFSSFPIHFILFLSALGFGGSFLALFLSGYKMAFFLSLWAVMMLAVGIVGLYVLKIYQNTTNRPLYIIKEIIR